MNFIRVMMVRFNRDGIYAPSRVTPGVMSVSAEVAGSKPRQRLISFEPDGYSNPVMMPVYAVGLDGDYIRLENVVEAGYIGGVLQLVKVSE